MSLLWFGIGWTVVAIGADRTGGQRTVGVVSSAMPVRCAVRSRFAYRLGLREEFDAGCSAAASVIIDRSRALCLPLASGCSTFVRTGRRREQCSTRSHATMAVRASTEFGDCGHGVRGQAERPRQEPIRDPATAPCPGGIGERRSGLLLCFRRRGGDGVRVGVRAGARLFLGTGLHRHRITGRPLDRRFRLFGGGRLRWAVGVDLAGYAGRLR